MTAVAPDEAWGFEWGTADGNGGFVRLALHREERVAWYWAYLWRPERGPVVVRDHEVTLPRGRALEIRADSLWSELVCETPGEHWSIGLEAFGVALDEPEDALHGEIGERIALGFDFEWETSGDSFSSEFDGVVYDEQPGLVHGEVLLGRDRIPLDTAGRFEHSVGAQDATDESLRISVACDDGSWASFRGERRHPLSAGVRWEGGKALPLDLRSAQAAHGIDVRASALILSGDRTVQRGLGAGTSAERPGTGWIESVVPPVRRSPDGSRNP
jgi:hypothetical protein